jgi:hypothetical protein
MNDIINVSLEEIEMMCRWLIYRGRESDVPKDTPHMRFRAEPPGLDREVGDTDALEVVPQGMPD